MSCTLKKKNNIIDTCILFPILAPTKQKMCNISYFMNDVVLNLDFAYLPSY